MTHLVLEEAVKRNRKVGVMYIDFEAQYADTVAHVSEMFEMYADNIDAHWICVPMLLRNAVTIFEPQWLCWDRERKADWGREMPACAKTDDDYSFSTENMEFEEFVVPFGEWYGQGQPCAAFIGIRADESLHRYCAVATWEKRELMFNGRRWPTKVGDDLWNIYPI